MSVESIIAFVHPYYTKIIDFIMVPNHISQVLLIAVTFLVAKVLAHGPTYRLDRFFRQRWDKQTLDRRNEEALVSLIFPIFALLMQMVVIWGAEIMGEEHAMFTISVKLLAAWIAIRFVTSLVRFPLWSQMIAIIAWSVVALSIVGILDDAIILLDNYAFHIGKWRISPLTILKGLVSLVVLLWLAGFIARFLDVQINRLPNLTPSLKVLISKIFKITLVVVALLVALESFGIDLTALAVFGGAIGLGLGFGLQKVVSNLVSGIILLLDRSVKPGDVIEVANSFGWVNSLGARYVSVLTRDGVEHLIPNEHLITEKVVNWSHSSSKVRLKIPIGVAYDADVRKAMDLCLEAANESKRILPAPGPVCRLMEFGDSAVNLELRVWIDDPVHGVTNVRSEVLLAIWDKFHEHQIGIPYPQRDVHIRSYIEESAVLTKASTKKKSATKK